MTDRLIFAMYFIFWTFAVSAFQPGAFTLPYKINNPDKVFELEKDLNEISGLTTSPDENLLTAIQDEDGILYFINIKDGSIEKMIPFWKKGDYEGVEYANGKYVVIKSTGTMYFVSFHSSDSILTEKKKSHLNKNHDVEGITYDQITNRFLIACKGKADTLPNSQSSLRYVYQMVDGKIERIPEMVIYAIEVI